MGFSWCRAPTTTTDQTRNLARCPSVPTRDEAGQVRTAHQPRAAGLVLAGSPFVAALHASTGNNARQVGGTGKPVAAWPVLARLTLVPTPPTRRWRNAGEVGTTHQPCATVLVLAGLPPVPARCTCDGLDARQISRADQPGAAGLVLTGIAVVRAVERAGALLTTRRQQRAGQPASDDAESLPAVSRHRQAPRRDIECVSVHGLFHPP